MSEAPILTTDRLRLRPRKAEDAEAMFATFSDPDLMTWWSHAPFTSIAELRTDLARSDPAWRRWAITLIDDDRAIGFVAAGEKRQGKVTEIVYILARAHWGAGIAREAVTAVIDQLFAEGQRRLFADTDPDNAASLALLERLGFQREGLLRGEWETHIGVRDSVILGLLENDWRR
ncbi:N-acetyltransferase [Sphingomonas koreensis]|nr:N-acetyltransferase [Sphingomonas koreensis]